MNDQGWIKLHRKLLDNPICLKDTQHLAVWIYLLLNATHKGYDVVFNGKRITLQPGQVITGRKSIASKLNISESKVQRICTLLESEQQIEQLTTPQSRLITILNWHTYQQSEQQNEQQVNNNRTTSEQQVNTNKNVKKVKNVNKISTRVDSKKPDPRISELVEYYEDMLGHSLDGTKKENRRYCYNLLKKIKKEYPDKDEVLGVRVLIEYALKDNFHAQNSTNFKYLFYNFHKIFNSISNKRKSIAVI